MERRSQSALTLTPPLYMLTHVHTHTRCHSIKRELKFIPMSRCHRIIESHIVSYSNGTRTCRAIDTKHLFSALRPVAGVKVHPWTPVGLAVGAAAKPVVPYACLQSNGATLTDICTVCVGKHEKLMTRFFFGKSCSLQSPVML